MSKNCIRCGHAQRTGIDLLCDICRRDVKAAADRSLSPLELICTLCPSLEEDVLLALRFLYYVRTSPVVADEHYDEAETEYLSRPEVEDSILMNPGSDNEKDYPKHIQALAYYLAHKGWEMGQGKQPEMKQGELFS